MNKLLINDAGVLNIDMDPKLLVVVSIIRVSQLMYFIE